MNEQKLLTTNLPEADTLTPMQRIFVAEYLRTWNATKAARAAGYSCVRASANDCMQNPVIRKAIDEELSAYEVGAKHVLAVLSEQARLNVNDFLDDEGRVDRAKVKKHGQLVRRYRYKLRKTEKNGDQIFDEELELIDSQAALFFLGKHNKLLTDGDGERQSTQIVQTIINLVFQTAEQELPKELAGRLLIALGEKMKTVKG